MKAILSKTIEPDINAGQNTADPQARECVGTIVEYRLLGLLVYRKKLVTPNFYGLTTWEYYQDI